MKHQGSSKNKGSAAGNRSADSDAKRSVETGTSGASCQVDALAQQNKDHEGFTLPQSGRCGCTANVKTYVVTSELWMVSKKLDLWPMHMNVLFDVECAAGDQASGCRSSRAAGGIAQQQFSGELPEPQ